MYRRARMADVASRARGGLRRRRGLRRRGRVRLGRVLPEHRPGRGLPDHGELCWRPWRTGDAGPSHVELEAAGSRLPYTFSRRIEVDGEDVLVSYVVTNTGDAPFRALWAMHPLLAVEPGARILLPGVDGAAVVASASAAALARDGLVRWPATPAADGSSVDLSTYGGRPGFALKLVVGRAPRRVALADPGAHAWLGFEPATDVVPHLGVWLNEGGVARRADPAPPRRDRADVGLADDLGEAVAAGSGMAASSPAGCTAWRVRLRLGCGENELREWLDSD